MTEQKSLFDETNDRNSNTPVECLGMTFENDEARRSYFLEKLREKLQDPEFRKIEGFPIGGDEDILALSDPPYYTACPNPFIRDFVEYYGTSYNPNDYYKRLPFAADTSGGKNDRIYNSHAYHTKSPWQVVAQYIEHFTQPGDLVLDAFSGSGMTGAALLAVGGQRKAILCELSPIATMISSHIVASKGIVDARQRAQKILDHVEKKYGWMFQTEHTGWSSSIRDHRGVTNGSSYGVGNIQFTLWSDVYLCPECTSEFVYWKTSIDYEAKSLRTKFPCPHCTAPLTKESSEKVFETTWDPILKTQTKRAKQVPVLINYAVGSKRFEKFPDSRDIAVFQRVEELASTINFPAIKMMFRDPAWGDMYRSGYHAGMTHVHHFYWWRSLIVLSDVYPQIAHDPDLRFWFTSTLPWCNRENRLHVGNYFGKKGGVITSYRGAIYIASLAIETNPIERLRYRIDTALIEPNTPNSKVIISTQSSTKLSSIPDNYIDYVFVDPPFGNNLIYSELNFIWESWLRVWTNNQKEAIISNFQRKDLQNYENTLRDVFKELCRTLKPERWITIQFHNSQNSVWNAIQSALFEAGFVVADVRTMDKGKSSFKQVVAAGAVKKDLVISAYKPNIQIEENFQLEIGTKDIAWAFVLSHLEKLPQPQVIVGEMEVVPERMGYLLFDRMIAFHLQRGMTIPISAPEFYAQLPERFIPRDDMYFLPEQVAEYDQKRKTVREVLQLELFVTNESSAVQWLRQQLLRKPQTFKELHPQFMREIAAWSKYEQVRELKDLLDENFLCYRGSGKIPKQIVSWLKKSSKYYHKIQEFLAKSCLDGLGLEIQDEEIISASQERYYVPDPNEESDLIQLKEKSLLKLFDEYVQSKQKKIKVIRQEAVQIGFAKAWQGREYQTIVSVGKKIPESVLQENPKLLMYYDQSVTRTGEDE